MRAYAAIAGLLVGLLLVVSGASARSAGRPTPTVGDFWDMSSNVSTSGTNSTTTSHSQIAAFESVTVNGQTYDAVRMTSHTASSSSGSQSGQSFFSNTTSDSTSWSRRSDGASLKSESTTTSVTNIPGLPPQYQQPSRTTTSSIVYDPPCIGFEFPIEVGKTWVSDCKGTVTTDGQSHPLNSSVSFSVVREESVTVPAGTFDAFVLENVTGGNKVDSWWAPAACSIVKSEVTGSSGPAFDTVLTKFKCAVAGTFSGGTTTTTTATTTSTPGTTTTTTSTAPTAATKTPDLAPTLVVGAIAATAGLAARLKRR